MRTTLFTLTLLVTQSLWAQDLVTIGAASFQNSEGALAVNVVAGDLNIQSSTFVYSSETEYQLTISSSPTFNRQSVSAVVKVENGAFNRAEGYLSANLAAGNSNQQHNIVIFSPDSELSWEVADLAKQTAAIDMPSSSSDTSQLTVELAPQALSGASGVIQMSQVAGNGNTARNSFQMPITIN
ncbi:hypothetical protein [Vibrio sinaloensis]|uniref:hypothetical protein n=1 Tax=Photobacterium sp. (strain ATCC 43367) TaxID=379097 RepID=UPI00206C0A07|nr:hypothetical protein [Vibrio sinaloensis]UPQ90192.1 hypothetical protein MTO69_15670 [Vibrio sinaloensis]